MNKKKRVRVEMILKAKVLKQIAELARRRYGEDPSAQDNVVNDILTWQADRWEKEGRSLRDSFWLRMTDFPLKVVRKLAWGKLIEPYFD